jgi:repressor LexA
VQVLGRVAAGLPLLAEENVIDTVRIDRMLVRPGRLRPPRRGDSMVDAGIFSGDYIFVKKQSTADRGDIVVALIGDEATVKYYFPEKTTSASSRRTPRWRRSWCAPRTSGRPCSSAR